jgi:hypothetical protein
LPAQLDRLAHKVTIQIDRSSSRGSHSCLLLCRLRSGERAVLKLSPDRTLVIAEASALAAWRTSGRVPRLLEFYRETGASLMEAIDPGTPLADRHAATPLEAIVGLVRDLHSAPGGRHQELSATDPTRGVHFRVLGRATPEASGGIARLARARRALAGNSARASRSAWSPGLAARRPPRWQCLGRRRPSRAGGRRSTRMCRRLGFRSHRLGVGGRWRQASDEATRRVAGEVGADPTSLWRWCACTAVLVIVSQLARGSNPTDATKSLLSLVESA